ncbi:MAG: ABC transporter ATP-binding protein [Deltaproteobacteria bacterium]|jgi:iron complex transport system ATP-binding protein|nr:ABC transporter ATP-binding protein [Deltaproteobacteria bacterium]
MELKLENLGCGYGHRKVVEDFSCVIPSGKVFCLLGPNGVGKTTLFKTVLGFLSPLAGSVKVDEQDLAQLSTKDRARYLAYVPQAQFTPFAFTVRDVIMMGRTSRFGLFGRPAPTDRQAVQEVIEQLSLEPLAKRQFTQLSGGERQLVMIARALAQQASFLLMDEPASNLDFGNQLKVLKVIRSLAKRGFGVFLTTHFPDHVFQCGHYAALMRSGQSFLTGALDEVITSINLTDTYGLPIEVIELGDIRICRPKPEPKP